VPWGLIAIFIISVIQFRSLAYKCLVVVCGVGCGDCSSNQDGLVCHISVVDSKHFYLDSHILLFCFSS